MRNAGGLDVIMLDGFGGIMCSAATVLQQLVQMRAFRLGGECPIPVMVVFSDRYERALYGSVADVTLHALIEVPKVFRGSPYLFEIESHEAYGMTMQMLRGSIVVRHPSPLRWINHHHIGLDQQEKAAEKKQHSKRIIKIWNNKKSLKKKDKKFQNVTVTSDSCFCFKYE